MAENVIAKLGFWMGADTSALRREVTSARQTVKTEATQINQQFQNIKKESVMMAESFKQAAAKARDPLKQLQNQMKAAEAEAKALRLAFKGTADGIERDASKMSKAATVAKSAFGALGTVIAGAITAQTIIRTTQLADQYNVLTQRVKTATRESGDFNKVFAGLTGVAAKNGASLKDTVQLFQNIARSGKELGATNTDIIKLTNTIQQLGIIGGSSTEEMGMALRQFSQSMAGGIVRAEEFNSIVENMPELAHRIATGLGVTDGQLRKLMLDGKLLSKDVIKVLLGQAQEIDQQFKNMPRSMGQAWQTLTDKAGLAASKIDEVTGATRLSVSVMDSLADSITKVGDAISKMPKMQFEGSKGITDLGRILQAGNKTGFGLGKLGDAWNSTMDVVDTFNPFLSEMERPTIGMVMDRQKKRQAARQQIDQEADNILYGYGPDKPPGWQPPATKAKPTMTLAGGVDEKAAKKAKAKHDADVNRANELLASMRAQNAELAAKLRHDDEAITKEKALLKLSKDKTLTDKERNKYAAEINKLAAEHAVLVKQQKVEQEREKLADLLASYKEKTIELRNQLAGQKELNELAKAEKAITDAVVVGKKETVAEQQKILAAAKEVAELEAQIKRQKIEKQIAEDDKALAERMQKEIEGMDEIGQSLRDQNEQLALKLSGQEDLAKTLQAERQFRKDILDLQRKEAAEIRDIQGNSDYTDADKDAQINKVKSAYSGLYNEAEKRHNQMVADEQSNLKLNKALDAQAELIDNIKNSTGSYREKLAALDSAYKNGQITQQQWTKTADALWQAQRKNNTTIADGVKQIGNNFTQAILNGQKLTQVFKDMGKALAALAAQKLIFEPLAKGIDNLASKLFGTGQYTPRPQLPGTGGGGNSGGALASLPLLGPLLGGPAGGAKSGGLTSLGKLGSGAFNFLRGLIPGFAMGGEMPAGMPAIVGEYGPELVMPSQNMRVFNASQTRQIGIDPEMANIQRLQSSWQNDPSGSWFYNKGEIVNQMVAWNQRSQQYQREMAQIQEALVRQQAAQMYDATSGGGPDRGYGRSWAASVLSGDNVVINGIRQGRTLMQAGHAFDFLSNSGMASDGLLQYARSADLYHSMYDGGSLMSGSTFGSYKSQAMGSAFGSIIEETGYGGDGHQAAVQDWLATRGEKMAAAQAFQRYYESMANTNPTGRYKGPSAEYLGNIQSWKNFPKNYYGPGATAFPFGAANGPSTGTLSNGGWFDNTTGPAAPGEWDMGNRLASVPNPRRFDPTDPRSGYVPENGTLAGWGRSRGKSAYMGETKGWSGIPESLADFAKKMGGDLLKLPGEMFKPMFDRKPAKPSGPWFGDDGPARRAPDLLRDFNDAMSSWKYDGKGYKLGGLGKDLGSSLNSWEYNGKGIKTGGLMNDLRGSWQSWAGDPWYKSLSVDAIKNYRDNVSGKAKPFDSFSFMGSGLDDSGWIANQIYGASSPMAGIANAPKLVRHGPQPFGGSLSPEWTNYDIGGNQLFNPRYRPASFTSSSSFDRWQTNPYAARQINARMTYRANGGPLGAGQVAMVGERGPELIVPSQPSYVIPNHALGGNNWQPKVIINNNARGADVELVRADNGGMELRVFERIVNHVVDKRETVGRTGVPRKAARS